MVSSYRRVESKADHVAFIMDGNRRWAVKNGFNKLKGHKYGVESLKRVLRCQKEFGISVMTFFALSKDNKRKRSDQEYKALMDLFLEKFEELDKEFDDTKVSVFGDYEELREDVVEKIESLMDKTKWNVDYFVNFCINYDGQDEILRGLRDFVFKHGNAEIKNLNEEEFKRYLWSAEFSAPDIIVRTGNVPRLSGFLLWDSKYSEVYFSEKLWPDFLREHFVEVLRWYGAVERKFGK